jgi:hypothetical protein
VIDEKELHKQLTKMNYPNIFMKNFKASSIDKSYDELKFRDKTQLLEGVISYLD